MSETREVEPTNPGVERLDARDFFERVLLTIPELESPQVEALLSTAGNHSGRVEAIRRLFEAWAGD